MGISRSPSYRNAPKLPTTRMLSQDSTQRTSLYASHPPARRRRRRRRPPTSPRAAELGFFRYKRLYFRYIIQHFIIYHEHDLVIYRHMTIMSRLISTCHDFLLEPMAMCMTHGIEALLWGFDCLRQSAACTSRPCFQGKLLRQLRYVLKPN